MKVLLITLALVAGVFGKAAVQQSARVFGPNCFDDPLHGHEEVGINATLHPLLHLLEESHVKAGLIAEGLSTLTYDITINPFILTIYFEVDVPIVNGNATYEAEGYLDARPFSQETIPSGNFTGSGFGKIAGKSLRIKGNGGIFINLRGKVQLNRLVINELQFEELSVDLGADFIIGGEKIDWDTFSRELKGNFNRDWGNANLRNQFIERCRVTANNFLVQFSLAELIDLIGDGDDCEARY